MIHLLRCLDLKRGTELRARERIGSAVFQLQITAAHPLSSHLRMRRRGSSNDLIWGWDYSCSAQCPKIIIWSRVARNKTDLMRRDASVLALHRCERPTSFAIEHAPANGVEPLLLTGLRSVS
nr:hypothetical protein CFP56_48751 [Quercus suber]